MNIAVMIQARYGSSRLPGKVLLPMLGQPMLAWQCLRVDRALGVMQADNPALRAVLCIAWGDSDAQGRWLCDDPFWQYTSYLCGYEPTLAPDDVLGRYHWMLERVTPGFGAHGLDAVLRLTGDCPLVDLASVAPRMLAVFDAQTCPYVGMGPHWGDGFDVEVIAPHALHAAHAQATSAIDREHVTPYIWTRPDVFPAALLPCPLDMSRHKLSVDTLGDFQRAERILTYMLTKGPGIDFTWLDVYAYVTTHEAETAYRTAIAEGALQANTGFTGQLGTPQSWTDIRYGYAARLAG